MKDHDMTEQAYKNGYEKGYKKGYADGKKEAPVVHGRYTLILSDFDDNSIQCSACAKELEIRDDTIIGELHYCPNCGARMDGGEGGGANENH